MNRDNQAFGLVVLPLAVAIRSRDGNLTATDKAVITKAISDPLGDSPEEQVGKWVTVPAVPTEEMEVAFTEAWYSKRRCIDDIQLTDAWLAAIDVAPVAPVDPLPTMADLNLQMEQENAELRNSIAELLGLLASAVEFYDDGVGRSDAEFLFWKSWKAALAKHGAQPCSVNGANGKSVSETTLGDDTFAWCACGDGYPPAELAALGGVCENCQAADGAFDRLNEGSHIRRYSLDAIDGMVDQDDGPWVHYDDHCKAMGKLADRTDRGSRI